MEDEEPLIDLDSYKKFNSESEAIFKDLNSQSKKFNTCKNLVILSFLLVVVLLSVNMFFFKIESDNFENIIRFSGWLFVSYILYLVIVILSKRMIYKQIVSATNEKSNAPNSPNWSCWKRILILIFPDYYTSKYYKEKIEYRYNDESSKIFFKIDRNNKLPLERFSNLKVEKKFFIEWSNWINIEISICGVLLLFYSVIAEDFPIIILFFTSLILIIFIWFIKCKLLYIVFAVYLIMLFISLVLPDVLNDYIVFYLVVFRFFSRSVEIILSFYKDVAQKSSKIIYKEISNGDKYKYEEKFLENGNEEVQFLKVHFINDIKTSLLMSSGRLSLAIHTLIEIIILCSGIYFVLEYNDNSLNEDNKIVVLDIQKSDSFEAKIEGTIKFEVEEMTEITPFNSLLFSASLGVFNYSFDPSKNIFWKLIHVTQVFVSVVLILLSIAQYLGDNKKLDEYEERFYRSVL